MTTTTRFALLLLFGSALAACGSTPAASPTATPLLTPVPTPSPTATPVPTATPTPTPTPTATPAPAAVLTTRCDVVGTAQGGSVSWKGAGATWELVISPGGVLVNPTNTSGEFGPLTAGTYTYAFKDAGGNEVQHGQFNVAACPT